MVVQLCGWEYDGAVAMHHRLAWYTGDRQMSTVPAYTVQMELGTLSFYLVSWFENVTNNL